MASQNNNDRRSSISSKASEPESDHADNKDLTALEKVTSSVESYPSGLKLLFTLLSIYLSVLLVALDRTIIATALPAITDHFHSFGDVGWVRTPGSPCYQTTYPANKQYSTMRRFCCP